MLKHKNILIIDDDDRNIFALTAVLKSKEATIFSAKDGYSCLKILNDNQSIDIVLLDIMMPEMDGFQIISAIRNNETHKNIPIIAVTAKAMIGDKEKCIESGANEYCSKPINIAELLQKINTLCDNVRK